MKYWVKTNDIGTLTDAGYNRIVYDSTTGFVYCKGVKTFEYVDAVLKKVRNCEKPFGGIQIIFIGDFVLFGFCSAILIIISIINHARMIKQTTRTPTLIEYNMDSYISINTLLLSWCAIKIIILLFLI